MHFKKSRELFLDIAYDINEAKKSLILIYILVTYIPFWLLTIGPTVIVFANSILGIGSRKEFTLEESKHQETRDPVYFVIYFRWSEFIIIINVKYFTPCPGIIKGLIFFFRYAYTFLLVNITWIIETAHKIISWIFVILFLEKNVTSLMYFCGRKKSI